LIEEKNKVGEPVHISATVTNTGKIKGEEVVQLYLTHENALVPTPIQSLKGFSRISVNPGESKDVNFTLPNEAFYRINENGQRVVEPGTYTISVGGGQPNVKLFTSNILTRKIELID